MELLKDNNITIERLMFWGFCGTFFFIPLATSPAVIVGLLTLSLWIFSGKFIKDRRRWLKEEWVLPVLLFMALPWIGLLYTNDVKTGLNFATKSHYWLFAFAVASLTFRKYPPKTIIKAYLAGLSLAAFIYIGQFSGIIPEIKSGQIGFINPITYSLLIVLGILLFSFYFSNARRLKERLYIVLLILLLLFNLAINPGRAGYFAFIVVSPLVVYKLIGKKHFLKIAVIAFLMIMALLLSPVVQIRVMLIKEDIKEYRQGNPNTSIGLRLHMWNGAIKIFKESPIIGIGTGGYRVAMKKYETPVLSPKFQSFTQPHNSFLYMAVSFGVVGVISLCWIFFVFLKAGWRHRDDLIGFSIISFGMVVLIGSLTDTQIIQVHTGILFALFTGLQKALNEI